jgi:hypothetical protein
VSGGEAAGRHGGAVVVGGARWGGASVRERRRGELVRGLGGVGFSGGPQWGFYRGRGGGERSGEAVKWPAR